MKVKENEIRPEAIFREYLRLTAEDTVNYFQNAKKEQINCPACGTSGNQIFNKSGFDYEECPECKTIYVSPRPINEAFNLYYTDSPSTKYWATTFYKETEVARREKLWKPKAKLIKETIRKFQQGKSIDLIVDIGGGYGVFDEEIQSIMDVSTLIIEPSVHLAEVCRKKGLHVIKKFMEDIQPNELPNGRKCFVSFELFEHLHDPTAFLQTVYNGMSQDDLFIFTTLSSMGVDIQVLGEKHNALSPPHHLNFLNPKSVSFLLEGLGFEVLEASTPGKLDIDILVNNKHFIEDNFWKNFLEYSSEDERDNMQKHIAGAGLSSHMMITCKKP